MKTDVKPIPDGYHTVTPYLTVRNAAQAIEFYERAFGAHDIHRLLAPDGKIAHAEMKIGDSVLMLGDESPKFGNLSPQTLKGSPVGLALYVPDVDEAFERAVRAGATVKEPVENKFWGDRAGAVVDPFGHKWTLLTHIEEVSFEQMKARMDNLFAEMAGKP